MTDRRKLTSDRIHGLASIRLLLLKLDVKVDKGVTNDTYKQFTLAQQWVAFIRRQDKRDKHDSTSR